ncbi:polymorphic toxin type 50 domain-containing protein [Peptostreptococcus faecalis]|uniref:polymorphic toxin type 50 domain-containing protein n=1 Tax=Peptostreptococcus faecalis TaxID=2045015 RepID=UPI000C7CEE16|nr:minor capsid protein [Peptostreptococcus faecalis]
MKNSKYWADRMKALEEHLHKNTTSTAERIRKINKDLQVSLQKDMWYWLMKFADNNELNYAESKKLLNSEELAEFKYTVADYIKMGKENAVHENWQKELINMSSRYHISRLQAMQTALRNYTENFVALEEKEISENIIDNLKESYYKNAYEIAKGTNVVTDLYMLDNNMISQFIHKPWTPDGIEFSKRIWGKHRPELVDFLDKKLTQGLIRGEHPKKLVSELAKAFDVKKDHAKTLLYTETAHFQQKAQEMCFKDLEVEKYQIVATLDIKTSDLCRSLDHKVFDEKDRQVGINAPPFHIRCRTTTAPYFDDMEDVERMARDKHGKSVRVKDMSYNEWYDKYVKSDPEYLAKEKAYKNRFSDREQHRKYRKILGKDIPQSFDKYQDLKYNNSKDWKDIKLKYQIKTEYNLNIHDGRQGKHIKGHNNYEGKSYLLENINPQELVNKYAGTGEIRRNANTDKWMEKQFFYHDKPIGYDVDSETKEKSLTKYFSISYSKRKGTHIMPRKETKND